MPSSITTGFPISVAAFRQLQKGNHFNAKLQHAWNKYGPSAFIFRVVEIVADGVDLLAREQAWLDKEKPFFNIVQIVTAAMAGRFHSAETKAKIGAANKGNRTLGRVVSQETREKHRISATGNKNCLGRKMSEEHRAKLVGNKHGLGYRHTPEAKARMANTRTGMKRGKYRLAAKDNG
jgi:group I intron endonuclease